MSVHNLDWSPKRIQRCRELAEEGLTSTQIAARMGISRGAVVGIMDRRGIPLKRARKNHIVIRPDVQVKRRRCTVDFGKIEPIPEDPTEHDPQFNAVEWISLFDVGPNDCRWPLGIPKEMRCCGLEVYRGSYCRDHHRVSCGRAP